MHFRKQHVLGIVSFELMSLTMLIMLRCGHKVRSSCGWDLGKDCLLVAKLFGVTEVLEHVLVGCKMSQYILISC
jgi:hypothetical protein